MTKNAPDDLDIIEELPDKQVKPKHAKFVQIAATNNIGTINIYALDENGDVWIDSREGWVKLSMERRE